MKLSADGQRAMASTGERAVNPLEGLRAIQVGSSQTLPAIRWFPVEAWHLLAEERPDALVGTRESLRRLCQYLFSWQLEFRFVDRAVFVVTAVGERPLGERVRDELWRMFGVPVFELFVAGDGAILAHECEAHEGWHVNESAAQFLKLRGEPHLILRRPSPDGGHTAIGVGFTGAVTRKPCACGLDSERVVDLPVAGGPDLLETLPMPPAPRHASGKAGGSRPGAGASAMVG